MGWHRLLMMMAFISLTVYTAGSHMASLWAPLVDNSGVLLNNLEQLYNSSLPNVLEMFLCFKGHSSRT